MTCKSRTIWPILALVLFLGTTGGFAQTLLDPSTLTKYIDPLPQPPVRTPTGTLNGDPLYDVYVRQANQKMHSELDSTPVFTYDGATPGATFLVQTDNPIAVIFHNELPDSHVLPVDTMIEAMRGMGWGASSRYVTHLHGGDVEAVDDGWPFAFTYPGGADTFYYPNSQQAATLWYHDHSMGITRLNAYAGIAGFYIIVDPYERGLNMPEGAFELGIAVQDRQFYADGRLYYPADWVPEHFGDVALVNGKIWPKLEVDPRKYRIHLLNGCNDRFLSMKLLRCDSLGNVASDSAGGPPFYMVGTEQGLVSRTVVLNDTTDVFPRRLLIGPGDRRDLIIDFAGQQGQYLLMHNNASAPFDGTYPQYPENPLPELFLVHVKDTTVSDPYSIPWTPRYQPLYDTTAVAAHRNIIMEEMHDSLGNPTMVLLNGKHFMDSITELPTLGTSEVWNYVNTTMDMHPMHSHLINFQVFERQPFNVDWYMQHQEIVYTGPPELPAEDELGRRDMVYTPPGYVTRVVTSQYNRLGKYVYHCHILAHEENEMMRPFEVVEPPTVTVVAPNGPDVWNVGQPASIICTHSHGVAVTDSILLTTDGGGTWTFLMKEAAADTHNLASVPNTPTTAACVRIIATGISGQTGEGDCATDFTIARRDAGISQILVPYDGQVFGSIDTIVPQARVNNYGTIDESDIPAIFAFAGYTDTQHVAVNLDPGSADQNFTGTTPAPGYYTATCGTTLPFDFVPGNDSATPVNFLVMDAPGNQTPDDGEWFSISPLLSWDSLPGIAASNGYHIQVATDEGFSSIALDTVSTDPEFQTDLPDADEYYWRVQGVNQLSGPWSETADFGLDAVTPTAPELVAPTPWEQDISSMPTFEWSEVTFFAGKPGHSVPIIGKDVQTAPSLSLTANLGTALAPKASGVTFGMGMAKGASPAHRTGGGADASDITYHLNVATDIDFNNIVISTVPTTTSYTHDGTPLDNEAQYYWRVSASDEAGNQSDWSAPDSFFTVAAATVDLVAPDSGEQWIVGQPATIICEHDGDVAVTDSISVSDDSGMTWQFLANQPAADTHIVVVPDLATENARILVTTIAVNGLTDSDESDFDFVIDLRDAGASEILAPTNGQVFASTDVITPQARVNNYGTVDEDDVPVTFTFEGYTDMQNPVIDDDSSFVDQAFTATTPAPGYYTANCVTSLPEDFVAGNDSAATISFLVMDAPDGLWPDDDMLSSSPLLRWDSLPGVDESDGYHIQVASDAGFINIVLDTISTDPEFQTDLPDADAYYWRVQGVNQLSGPWSDAEEFGLDRVAPDVPVLMTPTPWQQDVSAMPTFDWTNVTFADRGTGRAWPAARAAKQLSMSPASQALNGVTLGIGRQDASPITYHLRVATDINFTQMVLSVDPTSSTYTPTTPIGYETQFYWSVYATDDAGNTSAWAGVDSFVTVMAAPASFALLSPANGAEDQALQGNLIWQSSDDADSFAIYFGTTNPPTTLLRRVPGNVPTTTYTGVANQTYYWTVVAENGGGTTRAAGGPWSFETSLLGVTEENLTNIAPGMSVGPNPLRADHATLRYCLPSAGTASICVVDVTGRTVMTQQLATGRIGTTALDLHQLSAGVYLAKLSAPGYSTMQRLVVEK